MAKHDPVPLHEAVALALEGRLTQAELARRLDTAAPNVSRWIGGVYAPSIEDVARIEDACGRPRGFIYFLAGYAECPDVQSTEDVIRNDPRIGDDVRRILLTTYELALELHRDRRKAQNVDGQ